MVLVQDHLRKIGSKLANEIGKRQDIEILQQMELVSGPAEHEFPRNTALMLFSEHPEEYFPYTHIEMIHFPEGTAGKEFTEKIIKGPVQSQITQALSFIKSTFLVEKVINKAESKLREIVRVKAGDIAGDITGVIGSAKAGAIAGAIDSALVNSIAGVIDDAVDKFLS